MVHLEPYVMTPGTIRMPLWSADNWDLLLVVCEAS